MDTNVKGKKVTIVGLGSYEKGSGVSALRYFYTRKAKITVTDLKTKEQLAPQLARLKGLRGITYVLGKHVMSDFVSADIIVKNPGVSNESPYIKAALKKNIPVVSDISLFVSQWDGLIIGVTGTRGKSTTSALLHHLISSTHKGARLGGNIKVSPLTFMQELSEGDPVVLELSSWMCHDLARIKKSPQIAVVTNMFVDHLSSYKNFAAYQKDKSYIFAFQNKDGITVFSKDNPHTRIMSKQAKGRVYLTSLTPLKRGENGVYVTPRKEIVFTEGKFSETLCKTTDVPLLGAHNIANALQALCVAYLMGISKTKMIKALKSFAGLEYRLQTTAVKKGITYINDSTATSPDGVIAALSSFTKPVTLIAGGVNKELEFDELVSLIPKKVKELILLPGTATDEILRTLKFPKQKITLVGSMKEAVSIATARTQKGGVVLLSPGAASFGLFKNEFDRAHKFDQAVKAL